MPEITLQMPFPKAALPLAWEWLRQFPERNFDDYGPATLADFVNEMERREQVEQTWGVLSDGVLCGIIGYLPITARYGTFHGICFARSNWGRETTMTGVRMVIDRLFRSGVEKISASFFADNPKIHRFFLDMGAVDEGYLRAQTLREGKRIDMRLIAIFREDF